MADHSDLSADADGIVMALAVPSDSDEEAEVVVIEVVMGVLVNDETEPPATLPPDPPLACTGAGVWERVPACSKPIRRAGNPHAQCRWSELSCPWKHHAVWRVRQGREVVTLQPCPRHPRCLNLLCRYCLRDTGTAPQ